MAVITPEEVREVIKTELSDGNIEGLLSTADALVSSYLAPKGVSQALQSEITKYIGAHLVALKDRTTNSLEERIGDASITYGEVSSTSGGRFTATDLRSTRWGQMAMSLDPSGVLSRLGMAPPAMYAL